MPNYIVSYDLNGSVPTHATMDKHMDKAGYTRGRILETVWYVKTEATLDGVFNYIKTILSDNDRLLVVLASNAQVHNLLIRTDVVKKAWNG